jgi:hypothetical protein
MKRITYTFLLIIVILVPGCKKWLTLKPQDGIVREEFWQTKEQVDAAVTGIYASLLGSQGGLPLAELFFIWGEARTDMVIPVVCKLAYSIPDHQLLQYGDRTGAGCTAERQYLFRRTVEPRRW